MSAALDGAAVSRAVAETESVETQHTSHTVAQQTHLYKTHTQIQPESVQLFPCNQHCQANIRIAWWQLNLQGSLTVNNTFT